jgi:hypothetical protein
MGSLPFADEEGPGPATALSKMLWLEGREEWEALAFVDQERELGWVWVSF